MRYEIKIPIFINFHSLFENWIHNKRGIRKHYKNRSVKSIYYDTINFKNAQDNIDGISTRAKTRLRWYDENFEKKILEIKIKKNTLGKKIFLQHKSLNELKNFKNIKKIRLKKKDLLDLKDKEYQINKFIYDDLKSVSMTTYKRSYFLYENSIRITYDQNIIYQIFDQNLKIDEKFNDNKNVIEFKFEENKLQTARYLIDDLNMRPNRFSKYLRSLYFHNRAIYF